ncbi:MAG: N-acetyltransferase family protein [Pseudomonadota bacterium]
MIRPAQEADMPAIAALYAPLVSSSVVTFELEPPSPEDMTARWQNLVQAGYPYLVAYEGTEFRGFAYCGPFRSREAYRFITENSVYLAPSAQSKGLGKALMEGVIAGARRKGCTQMLAVITDVPECAASLAFHAALGFERVGTLRSAGYKFDRWLDVALLQRVL